MNCCSPSPPKHKRREKLWKPWKPSLSHGEGRALSRGVLVAPASECGRGRGRCWELQSSAGEVSCFLEAALRSRRAGFAPGALRGVAAMGPRICPRGQERAQGTLGDSPEALPL